MSTGSVQEDIALLHVYLQTRGATQNIVVVVVQSFLENRRGGESGHKLYKLGLLEEDRRIR